MGLFTLVRLHNLRKGDEYQSRRRRSSDSRDPQTSGPDTRTEKVGEVYPGPVQRRTRTRYDTITQRDIRDLNNCPDCISSGLERLRPCRGGDYVHCRKMRRTLILVQTPSVHETLPLTRPRGPLSPVFPPPGPSPPLPTHAHTCVHPHTHVHICTHVHTRTYTRTYVYVRPHT